MSQKKYHFDVLERDNSTH